jgi:hypothetical protein
MNKEESKGVYNPDMSSDFFSSSDDEKVKRR